jgi:hypothetical protein
MARNGQVDFLPPEIHGSGRSAESKERNSSAGKQDKWANAQQHDQASGIGGDLEPGW